MDVAKLHKRIDSKHKAFIKRLDQKLMDKLSLDRSLFINKVTASTKEILNILVRCGAIDIYTSNQTNTFGNAIVLFEISKRVTPLFVPQFQIRLEFPNRLVVGESVFYIEDNKWDESFATFLLNYIHENIFQTKEHDDMLILKNLGVFNMRKKNDV